MNEALQVFLEIILKFDVHNLRSEFDKILKNSQVPSVKINLNFKILHSNWSVIQIGININAQIQRRKFTFDVSSAVFTVLCFFSQIFCIKSTQQMRQF